MYYYDRFDSMFYAPPVHYTTDKPTGLVRWSKTTNDPQQTQVLDIIRSHQLTNVVNHGFQRGIQFEDIIVKRQKFMENKYLAEEEVSYFIYWDQGGEKISLDHRPHISSSFTTKSYDEFLKKLEKVCQQKQLMKQIYKNVLVIGKVK